jgi:hypothetical protein
MIFNLFFKFNFNIKITFEEEINLLSFNNNKQNIII